MIGKMAKLRKTNRSPFIVVAFVVVATLTVATAGAATRQKRFETAPREAGEPVMAIISIESQKVTFYDAKGWILRAPVSTGIRGRETPAGIFAVVEKNKEHRSNMYDDAKMPNMQRITWNGLALHGGPLPGYAASHGCVRMPFDFAASVFNKTRIGMRVIISPHDVEPIDFFHPTLFSSDADMVAAAPERADTLKLQAAEAAGSLKEAKKTAKSMARNVVLQKRLLRKLELRQKRADATIKRADKAYSAADKAKADAYERLQKATSEDAEVAMQVENAESVLKEKAAAAAVAAAALNDATQKSDESKKVEKDAAREVELGEEAIGKLKNLKKSADAGLKLADEELAAAGEAKVQAEWQLRRARSESAELAKQIDAAKSDLKEKIDAAEVAAAAANAAVQRSDEAKTVERSAARMVELRKETLRELEDLKERSAEAAELARQIDTVESDLKTRIVAAAVVAKIAHDATKRSDEAKRVETSAAYEVALRKETLDKLVSLKDSADGELRRAEEALSAADKAKVQAEEQLGMATADVAELETQIKAAESDLKAKVVAAEVAAAAANDASKVSDEARKVERSAARVVELRKTSLRKLESLKKKADSELRRADKAFSAADYAKVRTQEQLRKASAEAAEMATQVDSAKSDLKEKIAAAAAAKEAVATAKIRKAETAQAALEAKLALEPVSVYISRATRKLYVRRNTHKPAIDGGGEEFDASIEVPVTIYDPDKPIGTHIFTAMEHKDGGLRWSLVTIDNGGDARRALDRITIPQDVFDRIALTALPRSSIIISDEPLSRETNYRTEFVAVLSNQPQGGFITRKVTQDRDTDEDDEEDDTEEGDIVLRAPGYLGL